MLPIDSNLPLEIHHDPTIEIAENEIHVDPKIVLPARDPRHHERMAYKVYIWKEEGRNVFEVYEARTILALGKETCRRVTRKKFSLLFRVGFAIRDV